MKKRNKALEYYDYLVKTNPNKHVELVFYIRVYNDNSVEASTQPFLLDKECIFSVAEYVLTPVAGFKTNIENVQLYFGNDGETFDYAPFNGGKLKIDKRQAWAGYNGEGYYDCEYCLNNMVLSYHGASSIDDLSFYKLFLSYAKLVETCSSQSEIDYLGKCLIKDIKIEELAQKNIEKEAKLSRLEELLEIHKDLIDEVKKLTGVI